MKNKDGLEMVGRLETDYLFSCDLFIVFDRYVQVRVSGKKGSV